MKHVLLIIAVMPFFGCASALVAKNFGVVSFEDSAKPSEYHSAGNIEGKDCMWSVFGYPTGGNPTVRSAFSNAVHQKEQTLIPGQASVGQGTPVRALKNVTVHSDYFNVWALSRNCIVVTGVGLL